MEPLLITTISISSLTLISILGKLLHTFRDNIKSCWGITFRSPANSRINSYNNENNNYNNNHPNLTVDTIFPTINK